VRFLRFIAVASLMLMYAVASGHAEKRVALVIGNDRYASLSANEQLQKAVNDARAVGAALRQIGFDVIEGENLGRQALIDRLDEAVQRVAPGDTVFFFFSGHGVAVDGLNYILPADVQAMGAGQITRLTGTALAEDDVTAAFKRARARVAVLVIDACRNNPFATSGTKGVGGERGLQPHEPPSGVFTLYSAGRGEAALDRLSDGDRNPNSVFTRVLLPALTRPDLDLPALAVEVREEVRRLAASVGHAQNPAYYDETRGGRIFLAGAAATPARRQQQVAIVASAVAPPALPADPCGGPVTASFPMHCAALLTVAQERGLKTGDSFRECENCPEMVVVPAGSFTMGSSDGEKGRDHDEGPQHVVTISKTFAVGKLHVTVDQFTAFVQETRYELGSNCNTMGSSILRSWRNPGFTQRGSHPVVCVAWDDAKAYVDWLAKKTRKPYRLLTEAEWEYAARGQTSPGVYPRFWFGNDERDLCQYGNGDGCGYEHTSPAGHYKPNAFGLYDMFGNAWQWTEDCYHENYNGAPADGSAWTTGCTEDRHVLRGSASFIASFLRSAQRGDLFLNMDNTHGFRVARTLAP
jgi:formylglycine-generating enzyme required for sulfatase activity